MTQKIQGDVRNLKEPYILVPFGSQFHYGRKGFKVIGPVITLKFGLYLPMAEEGNTTNAIHSKK